MGDHSERPFDGSSVNNDQIFTSLKNLSLKDRERTNIHESDNENRNFACSSSNLFVLNNKSTRLIPQEDTGCIDGENLNSNRNNYHTVLEDELSFNNYCEVPTLISHSSGTMFNSPNDAAISDISNYQISSTRDSCIVSLAMTSKGSRYLQLLLHKGQLNATFLLKAVYGSLIDLMIDRYGYHVFNMIIDCLNRYELATIIYKIRPILVGIACSEYGSYSIQKLITLVKNEPLLPRVITSSLSLDYLQLMTSRKGRHTIELCLTLLQASDVEGLYEATLSNWLKLAKDPQGCLSLNFCIDVTPPAYQACLLFAIAENSTCLSFDPSGTFVLQHVLGLCNLGINDEICGKLNGVFVRLSRMQHGSHLVQKCIELSSLGLFYFFQELLEARDELESLVQDQFGNYVIQTALLVSQEKSPVVHCFLKNSLRELEPFIGRTKYALHVFKVLNGLTRILMK